MDFSLLLAVTDKPPLGIDLRVPLSALNFLEYAVWGAWWVVLGQYLDTLKFSRQQIARVYATMSIGAIVAPVFVGVIADRYFNAEHVLGVSHLIGAALLYAMSQIRREKLFYWVALMYALIYSPTMGLANSVVFTHIPDATRDFPSIRVLGTIGWIMANLALKFFLQPNQPVNNRPLILGSLLSLVLGIYSFFLPPTPPPGQQSGNLVEQVSALFQNSSFVVFLGASFLITIALAFYFAFVSLFLEKKIKVRPDNVGPLTTIGQWVEIGGMFVLPWFITEMGMKGVLLIGMAAVGLRYAIFAVGRPFALVVLGLALHGICFDFFFTAGFINMDNTVPESIRSTGQSLFGVLTYGLGIYLGTEAAGWLNQRLTRNEIDPLTGETVEVTDWRTFWAIPAVAVLVSMILFAVRFHS